MSYIRFGWGLHNVKGKSDSYIICHVGDGKDRKPFICSYGHGDLGMAELICDAIDGYWKDDPLFADWFKKQVAERLGVELREKEATFEQSYGILMDTVDARTLEKLSKKEIARRKDREDKENAKIEARLRLRLKVKK